MRRIDVSMPLADGTPAFPGDPVFQAHRVRTLGHGSAYNLSLVELGSHTGTHVDPPLHFFDGGTPVDRLDLHQLNGPCEVVDIPAGVRTVGPSELAGIPPGTERVLLRTENSSRWAARLEFFPEYVALGLEGARRLRELGVRMVGIDALSIEADPTDTFPVHRDLLGHGVVIVEGLLLADAPAGPAELVCLPLRLVGGDGGPARAVLLRA